MQSVFVYCLLLIKPYGSGISRFFIGNIADRRTALTEGLLPMIYGKGNGKREIGAHKKASQVI